MFLLFRIKGWPNYFIDPNGNVYSNKQGKLKIKSTHLNSNGYLRTTFYKTNRNGKTTQYNPLIHVLLFFAIHEKRKRKGWHVDHIDRNRTNNTLQNLRYVSASENMKNRDETNMMWNTRKNNI